MFDEGNDLTDLQREILNAYDRNPDADAAAVGKIVGCSESYARETIEEHRTPGWGFGL